MYVTALRGRNTILLMTIKLSHIILVIIQFFSKIVKVGCSFGRHGRFERELILLSTLVVNNISTILVITVFKVIDDVGSLFGGFWLEGDSLILYKMGKLGSCLNDLVRSDCKLFCSELSADQQYTHKKVLSLISQNLHGVIEQDYLDDVPYFSQYARSKLRINGSACLKTLVCLLF